MFKWQLMQTSKWDLLLLLQNLMKFSLWTNFDKIWISEFKTFIYTICWYFNVHANVFSPVPMSSSMSMGLWIIFFFCGGKGCSYVMLFKLGIHGKIKWLKWIPANAACFTQKLLKTAWIHFSLHFVPETLTNVLSFVCNISLVDREDFEWAST